MIENSNWVFNIFLFSDGHKSTTKMNWHFFRVWLHMLLKSTSFTAALSHVSLRDLGVLPRGVGGLSSCYPARRTDRRTSNTHYCKQKDRIKKRERKNGTRKFVQNFTPVRQQSLKKKQPQRKVLGSLLVLATLCLLC